MPQFNQYPAPVLPLTGNEQLLLAQTQSGSPVSVTATVSDLAPGVIAGLKNVLIANGQLLIGSAGNAPVAATLTGTANQIIVTNGAGSVSLSLPQSIDTNASVTFGSIVCTGALTVGGALTVNGASSFNTVSASGSVTLSGGTASSIPYLDGSKVLTSGSALQFDGTNLGLGVTPSAWHPSWRALEAGGVGQGIAGWTGGADLYVVSGLYYANSVGWTYAISGQAVSALELDNHSQLNFFQAPAGTAGNAVSPTRTWAVNPSGYFKSSNDGTYENLTGTYHEFNQSVDNDTVCDFVSRAVTAPYGIGIVLPSSTINDTSTTLINGSVNDVTRFSIYNNGNVVNTNNSYGAISDPSLKQDIALAGSQWEDVKALAANVVKYRHKSNPNGPLQIGFVSKDFGEIKGVRSISPGLVGVSIDKDTKKKTDHVMYSVAYMKGLKALGEALVRIEHLEAALAKHGIAVQ